MASVFLDELSKPYSVTHDPTNETFREVCHKNYAHTLVKPIVEQEDRAKLSKQPKIVLQPAYEHLDD